MVKALLACREAHLETITVTHPHRKRTRETQRELMPHENLCRLMWFCLASRAYADDAVPLRLSIITRKRTPCRGHLAMVVHARERSQFQTK